MNNGKITRKACFMVLSALIAVCACFFAMEGAGTYKYQAMVGDSTYTAPVKLPQNATVAIFKLDNYNGPFIDENLDDEYDLLDGDERWIWFPRLQLWVLMDQNGEIHYGTS